MGYTGAKDSNFGSWSGELWPRTEVGVVEVEGVDLLEEEVMVVSVVVEVDRLEFLRVPPPTGMLRRAPPLVQ